jgi:hypothetical protein
LIGKGGGTIKQVQRENDVQIKVSNDRHGQWVDLMISGSNDQVINNAFNHIKTIIGTIKEKDELSQSKSFFQSGIFIFFNHLFVLSIIFIDSNTNNTSAFSFSKTNSNTTRDSNGFYPSTNQNNFRNDNHTYSNGANNTFNSRGGGFSGLFILYISSSILTNHC